MDAMDDTARQVGLLFHGSELLPEVADGDLLLLDTGRCPWRPAGRWQPGGTPIVQAVVADGSAEDADIVRLVRRLEWTPAGWALTATGVPPIPVAGLVLVLAVAVRVYHPVPH